MGWEPLTCFVCDRVLNANGNCPGPDCNREPRRCVCRKVNGQLQTEDYLRQVGDAMDQAGVKTIDQETMGRERAQYVQQQTQKALN